MTDRVNRQFANDLAVNRVTGLDEQGRYFMNPCPASPGDYIEFLAEQDVLMALSMLYHPFRLHDFVRCPSDYQVANRHYPIQPHIQIMLPWLQALHSGYEKSITSIVDKALIASH